MSSFFTLPASQKKRKRSQGNPESRTRQKRESRATDAREDSISGSDISDNDGPAHIEDSREESDSEDDEFQNEDPAAKRVRLAEQYLANTQKEVLEDVGFDAVDIDAENLRRRMGERLKEDTAETKGKLYRWIAEDFEWSSARPTRFRHHQKPLTGVAIAGRHAYTAGKDSILVKWRLPDAETEETTALIPKASRKPRRILVSRKFGKNKNSQDADHHTREILCIAASQDGRFVATGGADKRLIVWDAATLKPLRVFLQHRDSVISLAFRRGTNQLYSASKDRTVKTWSLDELTYVETLFGHQDEVVDVSALAAEKCVTVGARDRTARLWKVVEESQLVFRGGGAPRKSKVARPSGSDGGVDLPDDDPPHEGSTDRIACIDDENFVTGSDNGSLSLWNVNKKKAVFTYSLAHGMDPSLPLEESSAEINPPEQARTRPTPRWITALKAIPFSDTFISGSWDGFVRVWKVTPDKRRIEALGCIGSVGRSVDELLAQEELSSDSLSKEAVQALQNGVANMVHADGIINDLAIVDNGDRAKDGIIVVAAIGKQHRLGRWRDLREAKNYALLFEVPRRGPETEDTIQTKDADANSDGGEFGGFD